ncbi:MAG: hypothetical protein LH473_10510 [Chitinophagales bacterium]|nr:hypothetical protein [Chitinophagales bacterium]
MKATFLVLTAIAIVLFSSCSLTLGVGGRHRGHSEIQRLNTEVQTVSALPNAIQSPFHFQNKSIQIVYFN